MGTVQSVDSADHPTEEKGTMYQYFISATIMYTS